MMSDIKELFDWIIRNGDRLPTMVIVERITPNRLEVRFNDPIYGYNLSLYKEDVPLNYGFVKTCFEIGPVDLLRQLKTISEMGQSKFSFIEGTHFLSNTRLMCITTPLYIDQLLLRRKHCIEICRLTSDTDIHFAYKRTIDLIEKTITETLGEDIFNEKTLHQKA